MDDEPLRKVRERLADAVEGRAAPADVDAALERARAQVEALAATAAGLESSLPEAVRSTLRAEAGPMSRRVNEIRGLMNQTLRRLERLETDMTAERYARVDDLGLLVDLITAGWRGVDDRLARLEQALEASGATVHHLQQHRTTA
jgi:predicted TIM-barrel fold metal-dependent hydrolase